MLKELTGDQMRRVLLETVNEMATSGSGNLQQVSILNEAARRLEIRGLEYEQAFLTFWQDLFRNGYLSWGYNVCNPDPPFCHLTEQGINILKNVSRDPANPAGYMEHLCALGELSDITKSYVDEALGGYNASRFKSAAVMIGAAAETLVLEIRDLLIEKRRQEKLPQAKNLEDWRVKVILDAIRTELDSKKGTMSKDLADSLESYWPAITHQIRTVRNDAGHPKDIARITPETVHAAMLIFHELVRFALSIKGWIKEKY